MVTKYVCIVEGCDFVTEDPEKAKKHGQEDHPLVDEAGVKLIIDDDGNIECEKM